MKVLLDENFPLGLVPVLQADGLQVEHVITLGWRGASDTRIRTRLTSEIAKVIGLTPRATRTRLVRLVGRGLVREVGTSPQDPKRRYFLSS